MVTLSFSNRRFNSIVADLQSKVTKLEALATKEEKRAEEFIAAHLDASNLAERARNTANNIGKLFA